MNPNQIQFTEEKEILIEYREVQTDHVDIKERVDVSLKLT